MCLSLLTIFKMSPLDAPEASLQPTEMDKGLDPEAAKPEGELNIDVVLLPEPFKVNPEAVQKAAMAARGAVSKLSGQKKVDGARKTENLKAPIETPPS